MSYSVSSVCWNCNKKSFCTDGEKIQEAVDSIHQNCLTEDGPHCGSGTIMHQCSNFETIPAPSEQEEGTPA